MNNNNNGGKNNTGTNIFGTGFSLRRFLLETAPSIIENGNRTRNFDIERGQFETIKRDRTKYNGTYKNIGAIGGVNNGASCSNSNGSGPSPSKLKLNKKRSFDNSKEQLPQTTITASTDPTTSSSKMVKQKKSLDSDTILISSVGSSSESTEVEVVVEVSSSADNDSNNDVLTNNKWFIEKNFCPICYTIPVLPNEFKQLQLCKHEICHRCLERYVKSEILEFRTSIACPQCTELIHPSDIEMILNYDKKIISKYEEYMVRKYLLADPDSRWCPAPDCGYAVIATGCASCPRIRCQRPGCGLSFCYHCKAEWHPDQTCDQARAIRQQQLQQKQQQSKHSHNHQFIDITNQSSELQLQSNDIKPCPRCRVLIVKMDDGSCNHMVCSICNAEFCWLCMKEISDLHYLSPSGCTFWGKKPWSRKKKIMWQIGTLIGAPVGIALVAGIAVPAMIIGIPVWIGKKIYVKYFKETRLKRNLAVATSVIASFLISPVLASLAVAVGVPILLFYVYGVVPVALCRSGCDVTQTTSQDEIHYDFNATNASKTEKSETTKATTKKVTKKTVCSTNSTGSIGTTSAVSIATGGAISATGSTTKRKSKLNDLKNEEEEQQQKLLDNISENDANIIICNDSVSRSIGDVSLSVGSVNNIVGGCNSSTTSSSSSSTGNHHRSSSKKYDQDSTTALAGSIINDNTSCTDSGNSSTLGYDTTRCNQMIIDVCSIDSRTEMIPSCSNNSNNKKNLDIVESLDVKINVSNEGGKH